MTKVFKPIYRDEQYGELAQLADNAIVNIGGTSSPFFTVGGRPLLFADGSTTAPDTGSGFTFQVAYGNSLVPAQINTTAGKNIIFNSVNGIKFTFDANNGNVTIGGSLNLTGLINGVAVSNLIDHINASTIIPKHTAEQINVNDSALNQISGQNVQRIIEDIDSKINELVVNNVVGFEFKQVTPSVTWNISHNKNSKKIHVTIWDSTDEVVLPNSIKIIDANNIRVTFSSPQSGKADLMIYITNEFDPDAPNLVDAPERQNENINVVANIPSVEFTGNLVSDSSITETVNISADINEVTLIDGSPAE